MANPQKENGYTPIANDIMEALIKTRIAGEVRQIIDLVLRKTYGWNKKEDMISNAQFVEYTKLKKSNVCRALNKAIEMNIVIKNDNNGKIVYRFNKDFDSWKPLSKKITLSKVITTVIKSDNAVIKSDNNCYQKRVPQKKKETIQKQKKEMYAQMFYDFYLIYPKKRSKQAAIRAWNNIKFDDSLFDQIINALKLDIESKEWNEEGGKYIPYPATWLNQKRWEDSHEKIETNKNKETKRIEQELIKKYGEKDIANQ